MDDKISKVKKVGNWVSAILLGNTRELIGRIDERTILMMENLKDIKPKVDDIFPKVDILWKDKIAPSHSPRQLNDRGNRILVESEIKKIVDEKKEKLLELVKAKNTTNAYDAEKAIEEIMINLPIHFPDITDKLKDGAFKTGTDINTILYVGGVYLRNLIFTDLGYSITDLDKPKTS